VFGRRNESLAEQGHAEVDERVLELDAAQAALAGGATPHSGGGFAPSYSIRGGHRSSPLPHHSHQDAVGDYVRS
jgi:hypothetical protein